VDWLHVAEVWVGANFLFGHDRSGNFTLLRALGARHGFRAEKIDPVRYKDFVVSSTRIRRLVTEGRVDEAGALLGHHYFVDGTVVEGDRRGREIGFPTANLDVENELLPPRGVYATLATVDGQAMAAVTNIGRRPTFGETDRDIVETHLLDTTRELYGKPLRLAFLQRLRDERPFADVDALREQIDADIRQARRLFDRISL
jgi:riboflavin kinase/FMN adenylyltransferase